MHVFVENHPCAEPRVPHRAKLLQACSGRDAPPVSWRAHKQQNEAGRGGDALLKHKHTCAHGTAAERGADEGAPWPPRLHCRARRAPATEAASASAAAARRLASVCCLCRSGRAAQCASRATRQSAVCSIGVLVEQGRLLLIVMFVDIPLELPLTGGAGARAGSCEKACAAVARTREGRRRRLLAADAVQDHAQNAAHRTPLPQRLHGGPPQEHQRAVFRVQQLTPRQPPHTPAAATATASTTAAALVTTSPRSLGTSEVIRS